MAIFIALLVMSVAIPSLTGALQQNRGQKSFEAFDSLVQEARTRSLTERKPYVLVWTRKKIVLRPEDAGKEGVQGVRSLDLSHDEPLTLDLTAALVKKPEAIWTFWPSGACEPATVYFRGKKARWTAVYNPFTAEAAVRYDD